MNRFTLEICIDTLESALAAKAGGADRLELCGELLIGGVTPSPFLYEQIRATMDIEIRSMVRPRFGDFCYTDSEFEIMKHNVKQFRSLGSDGVVFGVLLPDGSIDMPRMKALIDLAGDMDVTLHRAFDVTADPMNTLAQAKELGIATILTSGGQSTAWEGRELLAELVKHSDGIEILPGAGVSIENIQGLRRETGAHSFHLSGKKTVQSLMEYRSPIAMGLPSFSEYERWQTDEDIVLAIRKLLDSME